MKCKNCSNWLAVNSKTEDGLCTLPTCERLKCMRCEWYTQDKETAKGFCTLFEWNTDELGFDASTCILFECIGDVKSVYGSEK